MARLCAFSGFPAPFFACALMARFLPENNIIYCPQHLPDFCQLYPAQFWRFLFLRMHNYRFFYQTLQRNEKNAII